MTQPREKNIAFKVSLSQEDFVAYNLLGTGFAFLWFVVYITVVVTVLSVSGFYSRLTSEGFFRYLWLPAGLLAFLCVAYFGYVRWQAKQFFEKTPDMTAEVSYQALDKGLHIKRGREQKTIPWEGLYRVWGSRRVIAFFTSKSNAYIVPVSVLRESELLPELTSLLKEKVPKRRLRLPRVLQS